MKRRTKKTAASIRQADKTPAAPTAEGMLWRLEQSLKTGSRVPLMACVKAFAKENGCTPEQWLARACDHLKRFDERHAVQEKWEQALEGHITVDGFYCTMNGPTIHVIAIDPQGALVYYDGETMKPVAVLEALRILTELNDAAQLFEVEPWNGGICTFQGNAAWYSRLRMTLGAALQKG